ncbi:MAG TPA: glycosyltransferase family 4 protein [Pseudolabrys sp.]|nr:glycosyltransferase family 4 protein [Pseudolabrys sp.]
MEDLALNEIDVIIPNLHWRYSGVTATNRMMAPRLARLVRAVWFGTDRPDGIAALTVGGLMRLRRAMRDRGCIWHARRNDEMLAGLLLRLLGWPFKLVFTSAAQRRHSWITRALIARMDAVIATGDAAASFLLRGATVIPHGVDSQLYCPPADRLAAFAASGLAGKYGIGCFGRVRRQKGTDVFVEAMCRLLPAHPDFTALVIGPVTPDQRSFAAALKYRVDRAGLGGRVHFLGELPIEDVPRWYQRIAIYAFTSRVEGFGLTLLEAMAAGTALVAARAGAAERVVVPNETGMLVPPGDVDALVAAIEPLMRDPARAAAMGQRARERAIAQFSVDVEAERIAAVYCQVLEGRGRYFFSAKPR